MNLKEAKKNAKNINHIGFIMDGNRRWAVSNNKVKIEGHNQGIKNLVNILEYQKKLGIKTTTFYALSRDNKAKRGDDEYNNLMNLFCKHFDKLKKKINKNKSKVDELKIKVSIFGAYKELREDVVLKMKQIIEETKDNNDLFVNFCINYDGQFEIIEGVKSTLKNIQEGKLKIEDLNETEFKKHLFTSQFKAPEIIIRTGNSPRLSGFMLWDSQYSEIYLTKKMWPEFDETDLFNVLEWYNNVDRKFGK